MVSTDSTTEGSERPSSAESHMTFLSPTPSLGQTTPSNSSDYESASSSGEEDDMENAEEEEERVIEGEAEDGPGSNEAVAMNAAQTVSNGSGKHRMWDYMSFRRKMYRELYDERGFARAMMLEESMAQSRAEFQDLLNHNQLPPSILAKVEELKRKWLDVEILELEAFFRRLSLLREECEMCLTELKSRRDSC